MNIQALVFDLDGTAIPKRADGMPSQAVIDAVREAKKVCHVSIATGRPYELCDKVLEALEIDDLCILNGGTHLYSRKTNEYIWKQEIEQQTLEELFFKLKKFTQYYVADEKSMERVPLADYKITSSVGLSCIFSIEKENIPEILSIIKEFPEVIGHPCASWKPDTFDIHVTHELATKKHALQSLLAHLNVNHEDTMVAGDGGNDLPMFELAGWKVAMGNGADELKAHADWVAPSVDEDGLAVAIRKFILNKD